MGSIAYPIAPTKAWLGMKTAFHARLDDEFIETKQIFQRERFHRRKHDSMGNILSLRYCKRSIQFRRERQFQHLKRWRFTKNRCIHFYVNSSSELFKWRNEARGVFLTAKLTSQFLTPSTMTRSSDLSSEAEVVTIKCPFTFRATSSTINEDGHITETNITRIEIVDSRIEDSSKS